MTTEFTPGEADVAAEIEQRRKRGAMPFDLNRGISLRASSKTGDRIVAYKDEPGIYYDANGAEVSEERARAAGFDTDADSRERLRRERLAVAREQIEQDLSRTHEPSRTAVAQSGDFTVWDLGLGRHIVVGPDGEQLTPRPLPKDAAMRLFAALTGAEQ